MSFLVWISSEQIREATTPSLVFTLGVIDCQSWVSETEMCQALSADLPSAFTLAHCKTVGNCYGGQLWSAIRKP